MIVITFAYFGKKKKKGISLTSHSTSMKRHCFKATKRFIQFILKAIIFQMSVTSLTQILIHGLSLQTRLMS